LWQRAGHDNLSISTAGTAVCKVCLGHKRSYNLLMALVVVEVRSWNIPTAGIAECKACLGHRKCCSSGCWAQPFGYDWAAAKA